MRIVLTFDSFEEFQEQVGRYAAKLRPKKPELVPVEDIAAVVKAEETAKKAKQAEVKAEPAPEPETAQADTPEVDEKYRVEVRKTLAALNKKTGENTASKLIKDLGKDKLTDVALSDLPALMAKAKELLDA